LIYITESSISISSFRAKSLNIVVLKEEEESEELALLRFVNDVPVTEGSWEKEEIVDIFLLIFNLNKIIITIIVTLLILIII